VLEDEVFCEVIKMKTIACVSGILTVLSLTTSIAQDQKIDLSATGQGAIVETAKRDLLSAASPERLAKLIFSEKAPDRIIGKRFVSSGPLVALFKSNEPLQTFNPFSVSNTGAVWDRIVLDPYLPRPRGFTLFRLGF
jgi:hypothetical protein